MVHSELSEWLTTPRGQYMLNWELRYLDQIVADIFGFNALQIGLCEHQLLRANRMQHRVYACVGCIDAVKAGSLHVLPEELPFASQSLDLVVLPHALEFAVHPHQVLREVERVLLPDGHLLISGFNPRSLWGLRRWFSGNMGDMPWMGQYLSVSRLRDWLSLLGFEYRQACYGGYAPPVSSEVWLRRWAFMDSLGTFCWPFVGGVYVLHAVKRMQGMRLITPTWRDESKARKKAMVPVAHTLRDD
jgi:SAM-dependent methyltransferase